MSSRRSISGNSRKILRDEYDDEYDVRTRKGTGKQILPAYSSDSGSEPSISSSSASSEDQRDVRRSRNRSGSVARSRQPIDEYSSSSQEEDSSYSEDESISIASTKTSNDFSEDLSGESSQDDSDAGDYSVGNGSYAANAVARAVEKTRKQGASRLVVQASLALVRRKKESPQVKSQSDVVKEVDYSEGATLLYKHIENCRWKEAAELCRSKPSEARTWVFRTDKKKQIVWRMLPIHTAILYRSPVYVLLALIEAHPDGVKQTDGKKMLPLHMACRVLCKEDIVRTLLKAYPAAINEKDSKGRLPKDFLTNANFNNSESKILQKVNSRHRKNLLRILKSFEAPSERKNHSSANSVSSGRWSRNIDDRSIRSNRFDDRSVAGSVRSRQSRSRSVSSSRGQNSPGRMNSIPRSPRHAVNNPPPRGRNALPPGGRSPSVPRSVSRTRSVSQTRNGWVSPQKRRSIERQGIDDKSISSRPRHVVVTQDDVSVMSMDNSFEENDADDISRVSGYSRLSRSSRRSVSSRRSRGSGSVARVARKPRGPIEPEHESDQDASNIEIEEIVIENEIGSHDTDDEEECEDIPDGVLYSLWKDIESIHPPKQEYYHDGLAHESQREADNQPKASDDASQKLKLFDPPQELQKLMSLISSENSDNEFMDKVRMMTAGSRAPLPATGSARRVNACGALRALSKNTKNRMRLGRTNGVISCLLKVISDKNATDEERFRCINTLMFLCVPKQNLDAIFNADPKLLEVLSMALNDVDSRVRYNSSTCLFLLSKSENNKCFIANKKELISNLIELADLGDEEVDNDDDVSVDGSLGQQFANLGSPSGIRVQGAPATNAETMRGCRLNAIKVFLSLSKSQQGARILISNTKLMSLLGSISGTMTADENTLCMAIYTNLSRDPINLEKLGKISNLLDILARGMRSRSVECRKCAVLTIQNLSCDLSFRRRLGADSNLLENLCIHALGENTDESSIVKEIKLAAIHSLRNLSAEPCNLVSITDTPGLVAAMILAATTEIKPEASTSNSEEKVNTNGDSKDHDNINEKRNTEVMKYAACDGLAALSHWMTVVSDVCMESNQIRLKGRTLASMKVSGWNVWD
jgi:hypothetical protein